MKQRELEVRAELVGFEDPVVPADAEPLEYLGVWLAVRFEDVHRRSAVVDEGGDLDIGPLVAEHGAEVLQRGFEVLALSIDVGDGFDVEHPFLVGHEAHVSESELLGSSAHAAQQRADSQSHWDSIQQAVGPAEG